MGSHDWWRERRGEYYLYPEKGGRWQGYAKVGGGGVKKGEEIGLKEG